MSNFATLLPNTFKVLDTCGMDPEDDMLTISAMPETEEARRKLDVLLASMIAIFYRAPEITVYGNTATVTGYVNTYDNFGHEPVRSFFAIAAI